MNEQDKVLQRVKKMMALANDAAASEGERDNALRMAHATLAKHNLTMAEAEAAGATPEEPRVFVDLYGENHPWTRTAALGIAELFFCCYFFVGLPQSKVKHFFVGKTGNVYTAREMTAYIVRSIDKEGKRYARDTGSGGSGWRSFCKGAALQVYRRCKKIRADAERPVAATGTALVLASVYTQEAAANELFMTQAGVNLRTGKDRQKRADAQAKEAGMRYGNTISLHNQIDKPEPRKELK